MTRFIFSVAVLAALALPNLAAAWGNAGHHLVCDLAYGQLSVAGERFIGEVRQGESGLFYESCLWPDNARHRSYKGTYQYHFVNVPKSETQVDIARDCAALDCATVGIQRYATILAKPANTIDEKADRKKALLFLAHFVGDLHQPLHVGFVEDRGGNWIKNVKLGSNGTPRNLHSIWDSAILTKAGYRGVQDKASLLERMSGKDITPWQTFDLIGWTAESYALAREFAYSYESGAEVRSGQTLAQPYYRRARPVVEEQIYKASVRLAYLINQIAAGNLPQNMVQLSAPTPN